MNFFDLHCDTPFECYKQNLNFNKNTLAVSGKKGEVFEKWWQTFAIWINDTAERPWELYRAVITDFKKKLENKPANLTPIFAVEGGVVIEDKPQRLEELKADGIKLLTLTWNGKNLIGGGQKTEKGLTDYGKAIIKELNRLKIGCDLSHLNEKTFYSAIEYADFPLATHSNCFEICNHPRNLKAEQIKLIAQKRGIIGITFYPEFLGGNVFEAIYRNISLLSEMGFEKNIAIGSDFDGGIMDKSLDGIDKIPDLYCFLREKNIPNSILEGIFYKNAENYIAKL